jgi:maleamate amidohydrolase
MTDDIYAQQGFGQTLGLGHRPALLVVDFTNGFADPAMFGGGNIRDAILATRPVLEAYRRHRLPIVFTRIVYAEDGSDAGLWCQKAPRLRELTEAAQASHVVAELAPLPKERIVTKIQSSAFFATDLAPWLVYQGIDTVIVTGCTTSGCVRATVVDAMSWNFRPIVLGDCVGDRAIGPHEANLFDMGQKYADLMTSAELLETLDRLPATTAAAR